MKDSKPIEELLGHIKAARVLARKLVESGSENLVHVHDALRDNEQTVGDRLKLITDWNKSQAQVTHIKVESSEKAEETTKPKKHDAAGRPVKVS